MIESKLDLLSDGIGGGAEDGDRTVAQIAAEFRYLANEGRARSVSGVLRILREQSVGRESHVGYRHLVIFLSVFAGAIVLGAARLPSTERKMSTLELGAAVVLMVGPLWILALAARRQSARSRAQLNELRRLALATLEEVVGNRRFVPAELNRDDRKTFAKLRAIDPEAWNRVAGSLVGWPR